MTSDRHEEPLLRKMLPEQVSKYWDAYAPLIEKSLPPTVHQRRQRMANVLRAVLMEDLVVWVYLDKQGKERYVTTTVVRTDEVSLAKNLLIYSFTSLGQLAPRELMFGFNKLGIYADGNGCNSIIAYVNDEKVKKFLGNQGVHIDYTLAQIDI